MNLSRRIVAILAVLANILLAIGKLVIGAISHSASIFADGINSGTDIIASSISYLGIKTAEKPADKEHPYGHEKAELIARLMITFIIFLSAIWIIYDGIKSLLIGSEISLSILSFGVMGFSALVNGVMSYIKIHYGKKYESAALISDGVHSRIDLLVSLGVFIGLFATRFYTGLDAIIALLIGLYILKASLELGKEATDALIGKSADEEIENKIKAIVERENINLIGLRTQQLGRKVFAELKIKLPSKLKLEEADVLRQKIETNLLKEVDKLEYISIQIESHNISTQHLSGFGWGKRKPPAYCICENGHKIKHEKGKPCNKTKCPKCGAKMRRE